MTRDGAPSALTSSVLCALPSRKPLPQCAAHAAPQRRARGDVRARRELLTHGQGNASVAQATACDGAPRSQAEARARGLKRFFTGGRAGVATSPSGWPATTTGPSGIASTSAPGSSAIGTASCAGVPPPTGDQSWSSSVSAAATPAASINNTASSARAALRSSGGSCRGASRNRAACSLGAEPVPAPLWAVLGASQGRYRPSETRQRVIHLGREEHGWQRCEPPMTRAGDRGAQIADRVAFDLAKAQVAAQGAGDDPAGARAADLIGAQCDSPQNPGR